MSRTGKIAKLPPALQEELNHQLERGIPGRLLVAWINAHPAVQAVLREFFEGKPVNEQNLCAWRRGGFADWQTRRQFFDQVRDLAADAGDFEKVAANMAEHAARLLATHYAIALSSLPPPRASSGAADDFGPNPYDSLSRLKPLAAITRHVVALRRSDHTAARMKVKELAFVFASGSQPDADPNIRFPAVSVSPASCIPDPADPEPQAKSSQIKVEKIEPNPASPRFTIHGSPDSRFTIHDSRPMPPRLKLTFPPPPHIVAGPLVPAQVA